MNLTQCTDLELRKELRRRNQLRKKRSRKAHGLGPRKKGMGVRIGDRDDDLKAARGYTDPSTYVRRDGSEKLVGADWKKRMAELAYRSGGYCERVNVLGKPHEPECNGFADDAHHIVKRSVRRDDRADKLAHLSRPCHMAEDPRRVRSGKVGA